MEKKKTLWAGVSLLIVIVMAVTSFIRGDMQVWLLATAFGIWILWAAGYFLIPYVKGTSRRHEAKKFRKRCGKQKTGPIIPEVSNPMGSVLLHHVNYRISAFLQSVYPEAAWEWGEKFPERIIVHGGTGRIRLSGVPEFNFADVTFDQNAGIDLTLLKTVPMSQITRSSLAEAAKPDTATKAQNPIDPQVWYELQGRKVLEALIADLHSRGHSSLTIHENGDIAIRQADSEIVKPAFESLPGKVYWTKLCKVFESEGIAANITDGGLLLTW